jgi:hypothetical protein
MLDTFLEFSAALSRNTSLSCIVGGLKAKLGKFSRMELSYKVVDCTQLLFRAVSNSGSLIIFKSMNNKRDVGDILDLPQAELSHLR